MINWYKIFYWLTVADSVKIVFATVTVISLVFTVVLTIGALFGESFELNAYEDWKRFTRRFYRVISVVTLVFGLAWVFTPDKTDCMLIIAGGAIGNFVTTDSASKAIPADIAQFLHLGIQRQIANLGEDARKQLGIQTPREKFLDKAKELTKEQILEMIKTDTTAVK